MFSTITIFLLLLLQTSGNCFEGGVKLFVEVTLVFKKFSCTLDTTDVLIPVYYNVKCTYTKNVSQSY